MAIILDDEDTEVISEDELAQRVAILKRFKTLLTQQRDRFKNYLELLDKQQNVIESGSPDDLLTYVEMEEKIVADIFSIQKVIDPLEDMYHAISRGNFSSADYITSSNKVHSKDEVSGIKASLEELKNEAVMRSTKNKELLSKRMVELRSEIKHLRNNPYAKRQINRDMSPSIIDIQG